MRHFSISLLSATLLGFIALIFTPPLHAQEAGPIHPLDALTIAEVLRTVEILKAANAVDDTSLYPMISLAEPPKSDVLTWYPGTPFQRAARVITRTGGRVFETHVDLTGGSVVTHTEILGAQPNLTMAEWRTAADLTMADPRWQAAVRLRGITDFDAVFCAPTMAGYLNEPQFSGRRVFRVPCYGSADPAYAWGLPIEGLTAIVDVDRGEVLQVNDTGVVAISADGTGYQQPESRDEMNPVQNVSPEGANFVVNGGYIYWQNWSFHLRVERREGPVISLVRYNDDGSHRYVAYQMTLSEMTVPYMDPDPNWSYRTFMDVGEFGLGYLASSLRVGHDCPQQSAYFPAVIPSDHGGLFKVDRAICIFERNPSDPAWRHYEAGTGQTNSRANVELVVRTIPTIGNYDYVLDYIFSLNGNIRVRLGATGIDAVKAVETRNMADATAPADTRFGALVAPHTVAVYHDHYFSFRLDLDVDGAANTLVRDTVSMRQLPADNPRRSLWILEQDTVTQEGAADVYMRGPGAWRVVNTSQRTALGHMPSYELFGAHRVVSGMMAEDRPQQRAAFSAQQLWVTRHAAEERYAAGAYLDQATISGGLPEYVADQSPIENEDIVLWYTVGFHHITRPEDWPILPTRWHEFTLRPVNFFTRNPAIDLAPNFSGTEQSDLRDSAN
jgi:primary-amine oxidase